jgi:hypothetical protein
MTASRAPISSWAFLAMSLLTILGAFWHDDALVLLSAALIVLYVAIEFRRIPRLQQVSGAILIAVGLGAAIYAGQMQSVAFDALSRSRTFLLLFFAVSWLQFPVTESPSLQAARATLVSQPPGRRFWFIAFGAHVLGSTLNMAGIQLLSDVVKPGTPPTLQRRLGLALMQGFTSASCWTPFYIAMVVVLVAVPSVSWSEIAPIGIVGSLLIVGSGWSYDRLFADRGGGGAPAAAVPIPRRAAWRTAALLAALIGIVIGAIEIVGTSIPVTLGIVGPPFALIWQAAIRHARGRSTEIAALTAVDLAGRVVGHLASLRNETLVFVAANLFGVGLASAIPAENLSAALNAVVPWPDAKIVLLVAVFVACGFAGLHPVIVVIFISSVLPPALLGLPDWITALVYVCSWGMSTMVSPFSGTTLFMARATGVPGHVIGWRWSPPVVFTSACVVTVSLIGLRNLFG